MDHKIVVSGGELGTFVYQLPEDISKKIDSLMISNPLLAETLLAAIRNNFAQVVDFMNTAIRIELTQPGYLNVASELIGEAQDKQDHLLIFIIPKPQSFKS